VRSRKPPDEVWHLRWTIWRGYSRLPSLSIGGTATAYRIHRRDAAPAGRPRQLLACCRPESRACKPVLTTPPPADSPEAAPR